MSHTRDWNETSPVGSDNINSGDDEIRAKAIDTRERMAIDHVWNSDTVTDGRHTKLTIQGRGADPTAIASYMILYAKTAASGVIELYVTGSGSQITQLTKVGYLNLDDARLSNNTWIITTDSAGSATINVFRTTTTNTLEFELYPYVAGTSPTAATQLAPKGLVDAMGQTAGGDLAGTYPNPTVAQTISALGSTSSTVTTKTVSELKIAYGSLTIHSGSTVTVSGLLFSDTASYKVSFSATPGTESGNTMYYPTLVYISGASFSLKSNNNHDGTVMYSWVALGS